MAWGLLYIVVNNSESAPGQPISKIIYSGELEKTLGDAASNLTLTDL